MSFFLSLRLIDIENHFHFVFDIDNHSHFVPCKIRANYSLHKCFPLHVAKSVPIILYINVN